MFRHLRSETELPIARAVPSGEVHRTVVAEDGTRLFVRTRERPGEALGLSRESSGHSLGATPVPHAIFCDGIMCDGFIWKYLWNDLAKVMPVTHWHYRGHGRSEAPADPHRISIEAHADDLQAVRESLGDPPVVLVAHSMGCQVILEACRRHPKNVKGLVLICGTFGRLTSTFYGLPFLEMVLPKLTEWVNKAPHIARALWTSLPIDMTLKTALWLGELDAEHIQPQDVIPYLEHMAHVDLNLFLRMLRSAGDHSAWDFLPEITCPTLIIAGEKDSFTPAYLAREMAAAIPHADLLVIRRGTHVASLEHPGLVDARIEEFLRERVFCTG